MLRATTACTFLTSQLPKVVRAWCCLYILTSKCASRHNGVQFFVSHLASWLRTRRFSEPTFRPSGATIHWKNTMFRDFPTFSPICIFFLLTLSLLLFSLLIFLFSLPLPYSAFHLSILLASKLPSIISYYIVLYEIVLYCIIMLCCIIVCCIILCYIKSYHIILHYSTYVTLLHKYNGCKWIKSVYIYIYTHHIYIYIYLYTYEYTYTCIYL